MHLLALTNIASVKLSELDDLREVREPMVITGVLSSAACEAWCDDVLRTLGATPVEVQYQRTTGTTTAPRLLREAVDDAFDSHHDEAVLVFEEGLVPHGLGELAREAREAWTHDSDWFELLPAALRPPDCLVLAGEGATSTLHRDPYEWLGTSLCFEGSKIWRFVDSPIDHYRLDSNAFSLKSAGWQSDASLFGARADGVPSAQDITESPDRRLLLRDLSRDHRSLEPSLDVQFRAAVQDAGDLVLIPPGYWHQTYALEPSVSVASQRCGDYDAHSVFAHLLHEAAIVHTDAARRLLGCLPASPRNGYAAPPDRWRTVSTSAPPSHSPLEDNGSRPITDPQDKADAIARLLALVAHERQ